MGVSSTGNYEFKFSEDINSDIQQLMDYYGDDVLRVAYMFMKDKHRAEDVFQDVFIKVYKKSSTFKEECSVKTWIMRITINVCKDMMKSFWLRKVFLMEKSNTQEVNLNFNRSIEDKVILISQKKEIFDTVLSLSLEFKEVILLYYYEQFSTREISEILNIPEGTVRSRLHRARALLKIKLKEWAYDEV